MRRLYTLSLFCLAAGAGFACKPAEVVETPDIPTAGIRFLHLVPDTSALDFRPVDIVENSTFYGVTYRGTGLFMYKAARADRPRHFKIFKTPISTASPADQIAQAQTVLADLDNVTLEAGKRYTFIIWGNARASSGAPSMRVTMLTDDPADPGTQVALRIINASGDAVDGRAFVTSAGSPATPTWANVPALSASSYVNVATNASYTFNATAVGSTTALASGVAPAGTAQVVDFEAIPGTNIAGSAIVGIFAPRSVAGSTATNFTTPGFIFGFERRPPRTCALCAPAQ
jgi:hypothetical protein